MSVALLLALSVVSCAKDSIVDPPLPDGDRLAFLTPPSGVVAGQAFNPVVRVAIIGVDGNKVTGRPSVDITLYLDSTDPRDTLLGTVTIPSAAGEAIFTNLSLKRATTGFHLIAVAKGLTGVRSLAFGVSVGPPAKLAFSVQPTSVIAGEKMVPMPTVVVQDAVGNFVANDSGLVFLQVLSGPSGAVPRNNVVNEVNGVARFDSLQLNGAFPVYTLTAQAPTPRALVAAVSNVFAVTPGAPNRLAFTQSPAPTNGVGITFVPPLKVAVADSMGNIVTAFTQNISINIDPPNGSGALLTGTTTVACVSGTATFPGIAVDRPTPTSIRLRAFTATVSDTARSNFFQVF